MSIRIAEKKTKSTMKAKTYQNLMGYLFIAPAVLFFVIFIVIPILISLWLSLTNYDVLSQSDFIGLENYARLFKDKIFHRTLLNILQYVVMYVPAIVIISFLLALLLNVKIKGVKIFRALYYLPTLTSAVAASTVWLWLLNPQFGLVNQLLEMIGIKGPMWLSHSSTAMVSIVMVTVWMTLGGNMIMYLAAMQNLPESLYESASIEGANKFQMMTKITVPLLSPTTFFILTMTLIGAFQLYDQAYVLTRGGPANSTLTPVYLIYNNAFNELQMGYASAQAVAMFVLIFIVTFVMQKINKESYT